MKKLGAVFAAVGLVGTLVAYVDRPQLVDTMRKYFDAHPPAPVLMAEFGGDQGSAAHVVGQINGEAQFKKFVVEPSASKPVLLGVFAAKGEESQQMLPVFAKLAGMLGDRVACLQLDLFQEHEGRSENYERIIPLVNNLGLETVQLPFFLLFTGQTEPVSLLVQGACAAEALGERVQECLKSVSAPQEHVPA